MFSNKKNILVIKKNVNLHNYWKIIVQSSTKSSFVVILIFIIIFGVDNRNQKIFPMGKLDYEDMNIILRNYK